MLGRSILSYLAMRVIKLLKLKLIKAQQFIKRRPSLAVVSAGFISGILLSTAVILAGQSPPKDSAPTSSSSSNQKKSNDSSISSQNGSQKPTKPPPTTNLNPPQVVEPSPTVYPASILNLSNWQLTLPINTDHSGNPDTIKQPELANYSIQPYFYLNETKDGVVFRAYADGATTANSSYPRSELRQMASSGAAEASWNNNSETHNMTIKQAITNLPTVKPHIVAGQIHDVNDDVIQIRLEGNHLFVQSGGKNVGDLDNNYQLGSVFEVKIVAGSDRIDVSYNGTQKVSYAKSGSGYYFKAGSYVQSNTSKGDAPSAYGEVIIYALEAN